MATLREYYEKDFDNCLRLNTRLPFQNYEIESILLYDFVSYCSFIAFYIPETDKDFDFFLNLFKSLSFGNTQIIFDSDITLPKAKGHLGQLHIETKPSEIDILSKFHGEKDWISIREIPTTKRIYFYSETILESEEVDKLYNESKRLGYSLQFRSMNYKEEREKIEKPLAFISHDSRDKEEVAKKIAFGLQRLLCPVWYDEFSLKVGDNLRTNIEKGLKECKKCILILSPNFLSNGGWTKTEFDSIFTRQILEQENLVLPVWYGVSRKEVYEYSPSLVNILGIDWNKLGENEVNRQLFNAITAI